MREENRFSEAHGGMDQGCSFSRRVHLLFTIKTELVSSFGSWPCTNPHLGARSGAAGTQFRTLRRHRSIASMVCFTRNLPLHHRCNLGI